MGKIQNFDDDNHGKSYDRYSDRFHQNHSIFSGRKIGAFKKVTDGLIDRWTDRQGSFTLVTSQAPAPPKKFEHELSRRELGVGSFFREWKVDDDRSKKFLFCFLFFVLFNLIHFFVFFFL